MKEKYWFIISGAISVRQCCTASLQKYILHYQWTEYSYLSIKGCFMRDVGIRWILLTYLCCGIWVTLVSTLKHHLFTVNSIAVNYCSRLYFPAPVFLLSESCLSVLAKCGRMHSGLRFCVCCCCLVLRMFVVKHEIQIWNTLSIF